MSVQTVENAVVAEANKVVAEVKELYLIEKAHLQSFLDYIAKRPYSEVFHLVDAMKTARVAPASVVPGDTVSITSAPAAAPAASAPATDSTAGSDAGVTSAS